MIKDALEFLATLGAENRNPRRIDVKDPRLTTVVIGNTTVPLPIPPEPRAHKLGSIEDLIHFADRYADDGSAIFFTGDAITLVLDNNAHRLERATVPLLLSSAWRTLQVLASKAGGTWHQHKPFLRLLRVDLAGSLPLGVLHDRVKRVAFDNGSLVTADVSRNKQESIGRTISAKVSGEGEIPDEVTLDVPYSTTPGETARYGVRCAVEVDPAGGLFCLQPLPDELARVESLHLASIRERIEAETSVPAFLGSP